MFTRDRPSRCCTGLSLYAFNRAVNAWYGLKLPTDRTVERLMNTLDCSSLCD